MHSRTRPQYSPRKCRPARLYLRAISPLCLSCSWPFMRRISVVFAAQVKFLYTVLFMANFCNGLENLANYGRLYYKSCHLSMTQKLLTIIYYIFKVYVKYNSPVSAVPLNMKTKLQSYKQNENFFISLSSCCCF
jgi:hypothetical protein